MQGQRLNCKLEPNLVYKKDCPLKTTGSARALVQHLPLKSKNLSVTLKPIEIWREWPVPVKSALLWKDGKQKKNPLDADRPVSPESAKLQIQQRPSQG